ncbi:hemopexin repeat-containing protein [Tepidibacter aestuarii]|uniref:hemopexin repeat-containing protein n=1 Tax=Tepidibacter aestuarii TaxID=2925782 RepID=UPI0020BE7721|nr:hemopexin repeat-containing protein [Tepidibacter aestuarii]CAH2214821.1 protein of unknown function [Tepidibacter aestuarii]
MAIIKSAILWPDGKIYFFDGSGQYYEYDIQSETFNPKAKSVQTDWPGLGGLLFSGAIVWPKPPNQKAYFFERDRFYTYKIGSGVDGYSKPTNLNFRGILSGPYSDYRIDAGVLWPNGFVYFFQHDRYYKYDINQNKVVSGYPLFIQDYWPGLWTTGQDITAGFVWPKLVNGRQKAYFFTTTSYFQYDILDDKVDDNYPKQAAGKWVP